ncbi:MAG: hypothetical protein ACOCV1_01805 [Bacillota bacterium]
MPDKILQKEINLIKAKVFLYIALFVLGNVLFKIISKEFILNNYYIDFFILYVSSLTYLLSITTIRNENIERFQNLYEKLLNISFLILLYGSFSIYYYNISKQLSYSFDNINPLAVLLFAAIVFIYQLRKRSLYGNYKWIRIDIVTYTQLKFKDVFIFTLFFMLNILFFIINDSHILVGFWTIFYYLIPLIVIYLLFAFYEKNHYDEKMLLNEHKIRSLSKNASLFLLVSLIYSVISNIIHVLYLQFGEGEISISPGSPNFASGVIEALKQLFLQYRFGIAIITILCYLVIYYHIKHFIPKMKILLRVLKWYIILFVIYTTFSFISYISWPFIVLNLETEPFIRFITANSFLSLLFLIIFFLLRVYIGFQINEKNVQNRKTYWASTIFLFAYIVFSLLNRSLFTDILVALSEIFSILLLFIFMKFHEKNIVEVGEVINGQ